MKHFFLTLLVLALTLPTMAQVTSGNKFVNGTIRITAFGNNDNTQTNFTFSPSLGYFVNDQIAVGGSLGVISQYVGLGENDLTVYLAPFVRRYFPIVDNAFYFFVNGSVGFSYGRFAYGFGGFSSTDDAFSISLNASPGFAYFPSERWGLEFSFEGLGLSLYDIGGEGGTSTLFTLGATTSPSLGFSYYF